MVYESSVGRIYNYDAYWDNASLVFLDIPLAVGPYLRGETTIIKADAALRTYLGRLKGGGKELPKPQKRKWREWCVSFPVNPDNIRPLQPGESYPEDPHAEYAGSAVFGDW